MYMGNPVGEGGEQKYLSSNVMHHYKEEILSRFVVLNIGYFCWRVKPDVVMLKRTAFVLRVHPPEI